MDCWFCIKQHEKGKHAGEDYVYDLESRRPMSLRAGVGELIDGVTDQLLEFFTDEEIRIFEDVLIALG